MSTESLSLPSNENKEALTGISLQSQQILDGEQKDLMNFGN